MHNIQSTEIREEFKTHSREGSNSQIDPGHQTPTDNDSVIGKSFEEDDESIRSDDLSRSEALSEDFQTPSASLQNLASISQDELGNSDDTKIESEIDTEGANSRIPKDENQLTGDAAKENRKQPSSLSLMDVPEHKGDITPSAHLQCQTDILVVSPVGSASSMSPSNACNISDFTQSTDSNISRESISSTSTSSGNNCSTNAKNKELLILQPGTYNSKPGRKKMWYHVFTPSYKTRSTDFKKYFKEMSAEERLIVDYSCAIQKEILVQGRMYISQNFVSFYANIFGWQTTITIKFKDISAMTKENTALVIPNAVQITTANDKYFFTSFVNRDSTFLMLFKLWQTALLDQNMPSKEIWKLVHSCYGEVEIDSEEDEESTEDYISVSSAGSSGHAPSISTLKSSSDGDQSRSRFKSQGCSGNLEFQSHVVGPAVLVTPTSDPISSILNNGSGILTNGVGNVELIGTDVSDTSDSEEEEHAVDEESLVISVPICSAAHDDGKTVVDTVIPCDVNSLFTMLFTNSKFYLEFHTMRKTFDILQQEWQEKEGRTTRQVSFTVTLNQRMGPKHSQITESQVLLPESKPGYFYAVDVESNNAGIPYADAFYVTCHFCLSRVAVSQSRLIIVAQVRFRKSIWGLTKSFIEKNSWAGIDEFYSSLERSLKEECTTASAASPPPSPRGKAQIRRRPLRKKGPAPGIPTGVPANNDADVNMPSIPLMGDRIGSTAESSIFSLDNSIVLKIILTVLASLLVLNGFLYIKLTSLEASAGPHLFFSSLPPTFSKEIPLSHQEWLELLQKQEALHRFELQKWHDILLSALKILKQAETDLESLKYHVDSYSQNWIKGLDSNYARQKNLKQNEPVEEESHSVPQVVQSDEGSRLEEL